MKVKTDFEVIIVGGGLAGLISSILLGRAGIKVLLVEKKSYPFHKVCGEYVSNEVLPFLLSLGFDPFTYGASRITDLRISTSSGKNYFSKLDLGGFGLSRFKMDNVLFEIAKGAGVEAFTNNRVTEIDYEENIFTVHLGDQSTYTARIVIGSYGKRDTLDKKLDRPFIEDRTNFLAVKYHVNTNYPIHEIGLDNFQNGYCGIVKIEDDEFNLCYLFRRNGYDFRSIKELEEEILFKNPVLETLIKNSNFKNEPLVINQISFARKALIENHILMCGDAAGLIAPLCGNGMSMAIHAGKILCELIIRSGILSGEITTVKRSQLEQQYQHNWNKLFSQRLLIGRLLQRLMLQSSVSKFAVPALHSVPVVKDWFISKTHGKTVNV